VGTKGTQSGKVKVLLFDFNNVLADVSDELVRRGHIVMSHHKPDGSLADWKEADVIVVWQESENGGWRKFVRMAHKEGKRVVLVQHGRRGISRIYPPFNDKLLSDQLCVWGENDIDRMLECGVAREKIFLTGTPVVKYVKPRIEHAGINVVFSPEHWDIDVVENIIVAGALRKIKGINVITKLLEGEHNPREYDNPVTSNRQAKGHLETCVEVLQKADVVVSMSEGTFELLAQIMDIPVIIADIWIPKACMGDDRYKEFSRIFSDACTTVKKLEELESAIKRHVTIPNLLYEERQKIGRLDGGTDIKDPVDNIIKVILNEKIS